jgi:SP family sugar:H+ symporter-like MFS transporter
VSLGVLPFVFYLMPWTGMSLQSLQQLTGANYFFYYGATIFQSVGLEDSFVTQIILGTVNFVCTFGGIYVMEKAGLGPRSPREPYTIGPTWFKYARTIRVRYRPY